MPRTTFDFLLNVKRRAQLPEDGGTLSTDDILAFATDELQNVVMPRLMSVNEWHYAFSYTESLSSERQYRINPRAAGNRIISVELLDGSEYRFIRLTHPLTQDRDNGECYSVYGNKIVLSDAVPSSGTMRIRAVLRPAQLTQTGCSFITGVNTGANSVTIDSSDFNNGDVVDVSWYSSPYEVEVVDAVVASGGTTTTLVLSGTTVSSSWVDKTKLNPAETSEEIPLPDELHDYLAQKVAIRCMEARGFTQDMNNHLRKLQDLEMAFDKLVAPRNKGEFKAIVNEDFSLFRRY